MTTRSTALMRSNYKWIYLFILPSAAIFILFYLAPIVTMVGTSFTRWDGFNAPAFIGIENYRRILADSSFVISLRNLVLWSVIAATLHVGFGVLVAFLLFKKPFGWEFTRTVFMVPNVISMAAWALIYKFIFSDSIGVVNAAARLVDPSFKVQWFYSTPYAFWAVTFTWLFYAVIVTLLVLNDLYAVPAELIEAARIDGANGRQLTFKILLPLCRNSIGTAVICAVTSRVAMYESIALTTAGGPGDDTMNIPLILVKSILDMKYGYANTAGVFMFAIGIAILVSVNRLFRMNDSVY